MNKTSQTCGVGGLGRWVTTKGEQKDRFLLVVGTLTIRLTSNLLVNFHSNNLHVVKYNY